MLKNSEAIVSDSLNTNYSGRVAERDLLAQSEKPSPLFSDRFIPDPRGGIDRAAGTVCECGFPSLVVPTQPGSTSCAL